MDYNNENSELNELTPDEAAPEAAPEDAAEGASETVAAEENSVASSDAEPAADADENAEAEKEEEGEAEATDAAEKAEEIDSASAQISEPTQEAPAVPNTVVRYRWNYETQRATDEQRSARRQRSGILTYAVIMTAFFVVSFVILIASLLTGGLVGRGEQSGDQISSNATASDRIVYVREDDGTNGILTIQEISAQSKSGVVAVSVKKSLGQGVGTGFVLSADGYIATNYHVVEGALSVSVMLYDGSAYEATVINYSEPDDLAVLKIEAKGLPVLPIGDSDKVLVGDTVVVIGHPAGLEYGWSTTNGILSAINREVKIKNSDGTLNKKMTLLQTNANVNSGNSGGPMLNERGEVIGIISMKLANGYEGMGFAIPINGAMEIINAIIEKGHADDVESSVSQGRPALGVSGFDVLPGMTVVKDANGNYARGYGSTEGMEGTFYTIERSGFFVIETFPSGDAYGKLQANDLIFAIDGVETPDRASMMAIMDEKSVGDSVTIDFVRDGEICSVKIILTPAEQ